MADAKAFYLTTPIYYVNDAPHIGHAYTTTAGDVATRWHRQRGEDVWFLTGVDEHGTKVERAAAAGGVTPQEWVDRLVADSWLPVLGTVDAANDDFIRTTETRHKERVQRFWEVVRDNGFVYSSMYEGPYCVGCEEFKLPGDLLDGEGDYQGQQVCPVHGRPVEQLQEENWFFRLSALQDRLIAHYEANPDAIQPRSAYNEVMSFIRQGLVDISMSRSSVSWGIPLTWDDRQVIYVWFDALLNYATAVGYGAEPGSRDAELFARVWPPDVNLVGKDILRFHAVYWPAMLMAAGLEPPRKVFAHGWLLVGGEKMSKSKLTGIAPEQIIDTFGSDAFRYYFLRAIQFGQDGSFSWEDMSARYTSELANGLGNLASRATAMVVRYRDGELPAAHDLTDAERDDRGGACAGRGDGRRGVRRPRLLDGHRRRQGVRRARQRLRHRAGAVGAGQGRGPRGPARRRAQHDLRVAARGRRPLQPADAEGHVVALAAARGGGPAGTDRRAAHRRRGPLGAAAAGHPHHQGRVAVPAHRRSVVTLAADGTVAPPEPLAAPVIDTHTHLNLHDRYLHGEAVPDPDELLALARQAGVTKVVQIGCDVDYARHSVEMARTRPDVVVGVSVHPNDAARIVERDGDAALDEALAEIAVLARDDVVRAVGETGLDYFRTGEELHAAQQRAFRWHIDLARELDKTLVIHDRDSHDDVLAVLESQGAPDRVVFHCFSGDAAMAAHCAERGWFMSFAGPITYKANDGLRAALAVVPDELVLVETDAPYLTPVPHRGKPNASYLMPHTVRFMAAERGTDEAAMCDLLFANAQRAFGTW